MADERNVRARFTLDLSKLPGVLIAEGEEPRVSTTGTLRGFALTITLISEPSSGLKKKNEPALRRLNKAIVDITRDGDTIGDPAFFEGRLRALLHDYQGVIHDALCTVLRFFRFQLGNCVPERWTIVDYLNQEQAFWNPEWFYGDGQPIDAGPVESGIHLFANPNLFSKTYGIRPYTASESSALAKAVFDDPLTYDLVDELLCDARAASVGGHIRRSVLELAIATEVLVKQAFFEPATAAGDAFAYFEDRGLVSARVIDLLRGAAKAAFGSSFREDHPREYDDIDDLFRCRNKIAHRGVATYRRDDPAWKIADESDLSRWWGAVLLLKRWLREHARGVDTPRTSG